MNIPKIYQLFKSALIEKDGTNSVYGSIKRWAALILLFYAGEIVNAGLIPGGSLHFGTWLNLAWNHSPIDRDTLTVILKAVGTYVLGGATITTLSNVTQNYHNKKFAASSLNVQATTYGAPTAGNPNGTPNSTTNVVETTPPVDPAQS